MTFNHHAYIEDAMNGFCMQKTDFPYLCIVMDDSSTDGEQDVIKNYVAERFNLLSTEETDDYFFNLCQHKTNGNCFFAVFYLKYNHYSIGEKSKKVLYYSKWQDTCKYIALCEGDDYWIDERKLQMQVDALEKNPECTCSGHGFITKYQHNNDEIDFTIYEQDSVSFVFTIDAFRKKWVLKTLTCLYKKEVFQSYSDKHYKFAKDVTSQYHALKLGNGIYIAKPMGIYNVQDGGVWSALSERNRLKGDYNTLMELYLQNDKDKLIKPFLCGIIRGLMCSETNLKMKFKYLKEYITLTESFKQKIKSLVLFPYSLLFQQKYSKESKEYLHK